MADISATINLCLSADDNYVVHLGVAMASIIFNHRGSRRLVFHILDNGISRDNKERLVEVGGAGSDIIFYAISDSLLSGYSAVNHLSKATYARLFLADLLPDNLDKVLYLDADVVCLGEIAKLHDQELGGCSLGAVVDVMASEILRIYFYPGLKNYFNAGILLIDLTRWRQRDIINESQLFTQVYNRDLVRADQDILNCLFKDDWQPLVARFNTDLKRRSWLAMPAADTVILHYSDRIKPWHFYFYAASRVYYFRYLEMTPWRGSRPATGTRADYLKKYWLFLKKEGKRLALPLVPNQILDVYRRLLWRTYKMKR